MLSTGHPVGLSAWNIAGNSRVAPVAAVVALAAAAAVALASA